MGNLLSCLVVTGGLPYLLGSAGLSATGRLLAPTEAATAEVLASPFRQLVKLKQERTQGLSLRLVLKLM
jgi:hypothetical protein